MFQLATFPDILNEGLNIRAVCVRPVSITWTQYEPFDPL